MRLIFVHMWSFPFGWILTWVKQWFQQNAWKGGGLPFYEVFQKKGINLALRSVYSNVAPLGAYCKFRTIVHILNKGMIL